MKNASANLDTNGQLMLLGSELAERTDHRVDSAIEDPEIRMAVVWARASLDRYVGPLVEFTEEVTVA